MKPQEAVWQLQMVLTFQLLAANLHYFPGAVRYALFPIVRTKAVPRFVRVDYAPQVTLRRLLQRPPTTILKRKMKQIDQIDLNYLRDCGKVLA